MSVKSYGWSSIGAPGGVGKVKGAGAKVRGLAGAAQGVMAVTRPH